MINEYSWDKRRRIIKELKKELKIVGEENPQSAIGRVATTFDLPDQDIKEIFEKYISKK